MHISIENQKVEKQKDQTLKEKQNQICRDCGITADRMMCRVEQQTAERLELLFQRPAMENLPR